MPEEGIFVHNVSKEPTAGVFNLPPEFDKDNYVAEWVKKGSDVDAKKLAQPIVGTNYASQGWTVWTHPQGHRLAGRPAEVPTSKSGVYILMYRPRKIQEQVNALYGNVSKQHLIREQSGQSIAGQIVSDPGMLSDERIKQATGITEFGGEDLQVQMNSVPLARKVQAPPVATAEA